ncbi:MAG: hypothetical protein AAFY29_10940 [Pseudomonadota bacterium]
MPEPVKHFQSSMTGAPTLGDTTPGNFVELLKACLVNGFNVTAPTGLSYDAVNDEITATFGSAHGYDDLTVVRISGANEVEYNGDFRVIRSDATSIVYKPDVTPLNATATGTFQARLAPAGWSIADEDVATFRAAFSKASGGTEFTLVVANDQSYVASPGDRAWYARCDIATDFQDIDSYESLAQFYLPASHQYSSRSEWTVLADPWMFHLGITYGVGSSKNWYCFGDINALSASDLHTCIAHGGLRLTGGLGDWDLLSRAFYSQAPENNQFSQRVIAGYHHGAPITGAWKTMGLCELTHGRACDFPNPSNQSFVLNKSPLLVVDDLGTYGTVRGFMPGQVEPLNWHDSLYGGIFQGMPGYEDSIIYCDEATISPTQTIDPNMIAFQLANWREQWT